MSNKASVYITYIRKDLNASNPAVLDSIIQALEKYGHDVWCPEFLKSHPEWFTQLLEQSFSREVLIPLLSKNALNSHWLHREIDTARAGGAVILPIIVDDMPMEDLEHFWLHLTQAYYYNDDLLKKLPQMIDTLAQDVRDFRLEKATSKTLFGKPVTSPQFQCDVFMVMPFKKELTSVYVDHIKPAVNNMGLTIKRGDDPFSEHNIMRDVWSLTCNARMIIADCTGRNPNVFYEMGIAHTLGKLLIPITQRKEDIPFDIRGMRYIQYETSPRGLKQLEEELVSAIQNLIPGTQVPKTKRKKIQLL
jgi:hypothetical protein